MFCKGKLWVQGTWYCVYVVRLPSQLPDYPSQHILAVPALSFLDYNFDLLLLSSLFERCFSESFRNIFHNSLKTMVSNSFRCWMHKTFTFTPRNEEGALWLLLWSSIANASAQRNVSGDNNQTTSLSPPSSNVKILSISWKIYGLCWDERSKLPLTCASGNFFISHHSLDKLLIVLRNNILFLRLLSLSIFFSDFFF